MRRAARAELVKVGAAFAAVLAAAPLAARAPAYAHKAGVTVEQHGADGTQCWNDGMKAMNDPKWVNPWTPNPVTEGTAAGAAGGAFARGVGDGILGGKRFKTTYYDCLIAKGYTLRRPDDGSYKAFKKLKKPDRQAQMIAWSIAPEPVHPAAGREDFD